MDPTGAPAELVERFNRFARLADRKEVRVARAGLSNYVGEYKFFDRSLRISLRDDRLALTLPDFPEKPLSAASGSRFFVRATEAEFEFERDASAKVSELVIHNADGNNIKSHGCDHI